MREPDRQSRFRRAPSMAVDITALYCCLDDFCKVFEDWETHRLIPSQTTRQRTGKLSRSEMLFIMVLFHLSPFKHFKVFYHYGIGQQHRACFRELPHYDRFVGLMPRLFAPLMVLLHSLSGAQTGIYFADSTKLAVCHNRRIHRHKVFDGLAARGKTSMGWFFGVKLHFVINHKGRSWPGKSTPATPPTAPCWMRSQAPGRQALRRQRLYRSGPVQDTLAARPAPHYWYPPEHAELPDAPG